MRGSFDDPPRLPNRSTAIPKLPSKPTDPNWDTPKPPKGKPLPKPKAEKPPEPPKPPKPEKPDRTDLMKRYGTDADALNEVNRILGRSGHVPLPKVEKPGWHKPDPWSPSSFYRGVRKG